VNQASLPIKIQFSLTAVIIAACHFSGCAQRYNIQTSRGVVIPAQGKPRYEKDRGVFVYKDVNGVQRTIPSGSVRQIAPASDSSSPTKFNVPGVK